MHLLTMKLFGAIKEKNTPLESPTSYKLALWLKFEKLKYEAMGSHFGISAIIKEKSWFL